MNRQVALAGLVLCLTAACGAGGDATAQRTAAQAGADASQNLAAAQTAAARPVGTPSPLPATPTVAITDEQRARLMPTVEVRRIEMANLADTANAQAAAKDYAGALVTTEQILAIFPSHQGARAALPTVRALATVQQAEAARRPRIRQPYASGNWEYTVHGIQRAKELVASQFSKQTAKGEFVVVGVTITNIARQNFGLNSHDFALHDGAGTKYSTATAISLGSWAKANGFRDVLGFGGTGQTPPQVPLKYAVVYDVTPGAAGLRLELVQAKTTITLE